MGVAGIHTLLVANRGEIARRVMRTARDMGIRTVAVFSEPDARAPHVAEADVAVALGGATATESYLDVDRILDAARRSGADAVHPGYGFLAENAGFATACAEAGLTLIGPSAAAIEAMGSKVRAKELAVEAGVPVLASGDPDEVGFPLLVKASAGGGGTGMRLVERPDQLDEALAGARREAEASFGDGTVFCERWLAPARHVEVQVLGDTHGRVVHLFERECSVQRRHQKVIEEAPSPAVAPAVRDRMTAAAVTLAARIGYVGAGTVEFLLAGDGDDAEFFFLEMNTRLQVEHPVTEAVCGVDLVRLQIEVARGEPIPFDQDDLFVDGHAIEARLYAEDPAREWLPSTGTLHRFRPGPDDLRWDAGVEDGSIVSPHYDPMLAKVIAHGVDRREAAAVLSRGLRRARIDGLRTNRNLLVAVLDDDDFRAGATTTDFLDTHPSLLRAGPADELVRHAVMAATLTGQADRRRADRVWPHAPSGWRNLAAMPQATAWTVEGSGETEVTYDLRADGTATVTVDGDEHAARVLADGPGSIRVGLDGLVRTFDVLTVDGTTWVHTDDGSVALTEVDRFPVTSAAMAAGGPTAPVPGTIVAVEVAEGDEVDDGQTLVVLEAMKMEHRIRAPGPATVAAVLVAPGDQVDVGQVLIRLEEKAQ